MADIKWSAFPNGGAMVSGDQVVGLRSGANTQLTPVTSSQIQSFAFNAAGATGVNDAFVVTLSPAPAALTDGLLITMDSAGLENLTTTPTLKVNSFAAKPIVTFAGAPAPGDIQQNEEYIFVYSLTNDRFQLINPSTTTADTFQVQSSGYSYALDSGVANAYIANILPAQLTTQSGLQIVMTAVNANSGASTLTVNGVTYSILLSNGAALSGGEILVNGIYQFFYSAALTGFVLMNPSVIKVGMGGLGISTVPSNGFIPIGNGSNYVSAAITQGSGISITNGSGSITIASTANGVLTWNGVAGTTQAAAVNNGYIIQNASQTTVTLPATAVIGSIVAVQGLGSAGWVLTANTGQTIQVGSSVTSSGGTVTSVNQWDSMQVVCVVANTTWSATQVYSSGVTTA